MRYERMLMQPFSPGRYKDRNGKNKFVSDQNWQRAFPDCKFNKWLENVQPNTDALYDKTARALTKQADQQCSY